MIDIFYFFPGIPSGVYRPQWLNVLRGYSSDLHWSVDNINDQYETALDNICTQMKEAWEYRGLKEEPRVLRYEVFKNNLGQQLKSKRDQMKMRILKGMEKPETIRLDQWLNMVEHSRDLKKIEQTNVMREAMKCIKKVSTFGRSEGEVQARLVNCLLFLVSLNHNIRVYMFVEGFFFTSYMRAGLRIEQRSPPRRD